MALFKVVWLPKDMAIIHCKGQKTANIPEAQRHWKADKAV